MKVRSSWMEQRRARKMSIARKYGKQVSIAAALILVVVFIAKPSVLYTFKEVTLSFGTVTGVNPMATPSSAKEPCRKGSANCIRTTWTPTEATTAAEANELFRDCLSKYPQEGQGGIDKGGWKIADDKAKEGGSTRVEFRSGIGPYAKYTNFGRPFVDDLLFKVESDGTIELRSSSRKGYDDMNVNKMRVTYIGYCMPSTWAIPEPNYNNF